MEQLPKASRRPRKQSTPLEVHIMFEPGRLAEQCVQEAYARLIPTVHRRIGPVLPHVSFATESSAQ